MESFRNFWQSTTGKILLGVVLFLFVVTMFWTGAPPAGSRGELATVNETGIFKQDVDRAFDALAARFGGQIDRRTLENLISREKLLNDLISQQAAVDAASAMKLVASRAMVQETIRTIPAFQDERGQFSETRFRQVLVANDIPDPAKFLARVERELLSSQMQGALVDSAFATRQDLELLTRISEQKRDLAWVELLPATFLPGLAVTDLELQAHYDGNLAGYMTEETFGIDYLEVKLADFTGDVEVAESDIKAKYDALAAQAEQNADRRVAHILVSTASRSAEEAKARADEVLAKLAAGESFPKLAGEYSDDPGSAAKGGDLGFLAADALEPELAKAVARLKVGDVSSAVSSAAGLHLLKVLEINKVQVPTLAASRDEIVAGLRREMARSKYEEAVQELGSVSYESDNLQAPAEKLKLKVQSTGLFVRKGGAGIVGNAKVLAEALAPEVLEEGRNSGVIDIDADHAVVIHLREHHPAVRRPLSEVSSLVRAEVLQAKAAALAADKAKVVQAALATGRKLADVATEQGLAIRQQAGRKRSDQEVAGEILAAAFKVKAPAAGAVVADAVTLPGGGRAVFEVSNVVDGSLLGASEEQVMMRRAQLGADLGRLDYARFVAAAVEVADIERAPTDGKKTENTVIDTLKDIKEKARHPGA